MATQDSPEGAGRGRPIAPPPRKRWHMSPKRLFWPALLPLIIVSSILVNWVFLAQSVFAAPAASSSTPGQNTFQQFRAEGQKSKAPHGTFVFPKPKLPLKPGGMKPPKSSVESATMKPLSVTLSANDLSPQAASLGAKPFDLKSSDGRLEIQIPAGAFDLTHATTPKGVSFVLGATTTVTLRISETQGYTPGELSALGSYQLQVLDAQGNALQNVALHGPLTYIYHYKRTDLASLNIDPDHVYLAWPRLASKAQAAKQSTSTFVVPFKNNAAAQTLTAQSQVIDTVSPMVSVGSSSQQNPPIPLQASVQGNSGNFGLTYPLQLAPSPFAPTVQLTYSTADPNERYDPRAPADHAGDGWQYSMGAITASVENGTTWYFVSGVDNVSDRLIPIPGQSGYFETEHISHLRIEQVGTHFDIWDTDGNFYQFGNTSDSLQYTTSGSTKTYYRWDLDFEALMQEGPGTVQRQIKVSYVQDISGSNVRDSAIKQIQYGIESADGKTYTVQGTVDFSYLAPFSLTGSNSIVFATKYTTATSACTSGLPPVTPTMRCDDPMPYGSITPPTVMSTMQLQSITTYVGDDSSASHTDYQYAFAYTNTPISNCVDPYSQIALYCAGEHLLNSITPTAYLGGVGHQQPAVSFQYAAEQNTYYDSGNKTFNGAQQYYGINNWSYLSAYYDANTGVGEQVSYGTAYSNSHGTPTLSNGDNQLDPLFCFIQPAQCVGNYAHPDDKAWSQQVVTQRQDFGTDTGNNQIKVAVTMYHYQLSQTCGGNCVGDDWIPSGDNNWLDYYYDSEFKGFAQVDTISPSGDLTVDNYYGTEGWGTPATDMINYSSGSLTDEEVYSGSSPTGPLLKKTVNGYGGGNGSNPSPSCDTSVSGTYIPCETVLNSTATFFNNGGGVGTVPDENKSYTYDDIDGVTGGLLKGIGHYHNLIQEYIFGSNIIANPNGITEKWSYQTNDQTINNYVYYDVDKVSTSEIQEANTGGHIWECTVTKYDEGAASGVPTPAQGLPTTVTTYSSANCGSQTSPLTTTYTGYDSNGNAVETVDALGAANSSLYGSKGCTLTSAPAIKSSSWSASRYTNCTTYDSLDAQPTVQTNVLSQTTTTAYDTAQQDQPISVTDPNGQVTAAVYNYDGGGQPIVQAKQPQETGSYTTQSTSHSMCSASIPASAQLPEQPCYEEDSNTSLYSGAVSRTFYDSEGRKVETRTPGPTPGDDTVVMTVYNDQLHTVWTSEPFEVTDGSGWIDPNGAKDINGSAPAGTTTFYDALDRAIATQDLNYGSSQEPGITCSITLSGTYTSCTNYSLGRVAGDANTYELTTAIDPNGHTVQSFTDAWGNVVYTQRYSGISHLTTTSVALPGIIDNSITVQTTTVTVNLNAGNNTILFYNASGSPEFDRITVGSTSYEAEAPSNTLGGGSRGATVFTCNTYSYCSGGKGVAGFDQTDNGGSLQFNNVNVPSTGSYPLTIYYIEPYAAGGSTMMDINDLTLTSQTQAQYNALNKPISVTVTDKDPKSGENTTSVTTTMTYDDLGRLLTDDDPDQGNFSFTYDPDGHVLSETQTSGSSTRTLGFNYDLLGRLGCEQTAAPTINATGACSAGNTLVQNIYDVAEDGWTNDYPVGRLSRSNAYTYYPDGTSALVGEDTRYDQRGRVVESATGFQLPSSWNVTTTLPTSDVLQTYNDANQLTTVSTKEGSQLGYTFTNVYDPTTGTPTGLSNNSSSTANLATLAYNEYGQLGTLTYLNGAASSPAQIASETFNYDGDLRPTSLSASWLPPSNNSGTILSSGRTYDNASNVTSDSTTFAAVPGQSGSGGSEMQNFCYNEQNELIWSGNAGTQPGAGNGTCGSGTLSSNLTNASYTAPFTYTNLGQLWTGPLNGKGSAQQYLYCNTAPHELTGIYPSGTTCSTTGGATAGYSASYDAWGNETGRTYNGATDTLTYDALNHLTTYSDTRNNTEQYVYDASGNRVLKRSTTSAGGTTLSVYPSNAEEYDYSGTGTLTSQLHYYALAGHLIGAFDGTNTTYYLTDAEGSVLTSFSQSAVTGEQIYGPYGNTRYTAGTVNTAKGYTGQIQDSVTGLDYYNARYYDPVIGQFLSPDNVQGNAQGADPYSYVAGNPETNVDPTGHCVANPDGNGCYRPPTSGGGGNQPGTCTKNPNAPGCKSDPCANVGPTSGNNCTYSSGHCRGLTFTRCQNEQNNDEAGMKQKAEWYSLFAHLLGMGIDFITLLSSWAKLDAIGGATLGNFLQVLSSMVGVVGDISSLLGNIASLTGSSVVQALSDMIGAGANSLAAILKFISGAVNSWWVQFTGNAILLALQSVQDIATDGLMPVISGLGAKLGSLFIAQFKKAGWAGAAGLVGFGISTLQALSQTSQFQADECGLETADEYAANGCYA